LQLKKYVRQVLFILLRMLAVDTCFIVAVVFVKRTFSVCLNISFSTGHSCSLVHPSPFYV